MKERNIWAEVLKAAEDKIAALSHAYATGQKVFPRLCCRCCKLQDRYPHRDEYAQPREVQSWYSSGQLYYGGTCKECGEIEAYERARLKAATGGREAAE